MAHVIAVIVANKALFSALGALVVSEILPFVQSTKWNGILQGLYASLKKQSEQKIQLPEAGK